MPSTRTSPAAGSLQRHQGPHQRVPYLHRQHPGQPEPGPPGQRRRDRRRCPASPGVFRAYGPASPAGC